jgi:hypothetical protein
MIIAFITIVMTDPQSNFGSTSLDPSNINGEQVDVTTVDSLNLQK